MPSVVKRSVRAILIDDARRLVLMKRSKPGQAPYWTTIGGGVEPGDSSIEDALVRELREEIGAEIGGGQQVFLVSTPVADGGVSVQYFFVCRLESLDLGLRSGPEFAEEGRGGYDVERVTVDSDGGGIGVDLKPVELRSFIEANWAALVDAVTPVTVQRV